MCAVEPGAQGSERGLEAQRGASCHATTHVSVSMCGVFGLRA